MKRTNRSKVRVVVVVGLALAGPVVTPIAAAHDSPSGPRASAARRGAPPGAAIAPEDHEVEATSPDTAAIAAVQAAGGVPLEDGAACPPERLLVSYREPGDGWASGAYVTPLGPEPIAATDAVNGVVLCADSHHAFVGFEATWTSGSWDVSTVPDPAGGVESHDDGHGAGAVDVAAPPAPRRPTSRVAPTGGGADIEGYARYEPQVSCDPAPKPGALALRDLLLSRYPSTSSSGVSRPCPVGGRSEHKEGRAFDWAASTGSPVQRAAVEEFLDQLLATDERGNRHALARRMGVMYVIWDHRIWSAERADAGWRPYTGSSPHTDHVHLSLSWAGALARTSFWSGIVVHGLPQRPVGGERPRAGVPFRGASDELAPHRVAPPDPVGDEPSADGQAVPPLAAGTSAHAVVPTSTTRPAHRASDTDRPRRDDGRRRRDAADRDGRDDDDHARDDRDHDGRRRDGRDRHGDRVDGRDDGDDARDEDGDRRRRRGRRADDRGRDGGGDDG